MYSYLYPTNNVILEKGVSFLRYLDERKVVDGDEYLVNIHSDAGVNILDLDLSEHGITDRASLVSMLYYLKCKRFLNYTRKAKYKPEDEFNRNPIGYSYIISLHTFNIKECLENLEEPHL